MYAKIATYAIALLLGIIAGYYASHFAESSGTEPMPRGRDAGTSVPAERSIRMGQTICTVGGNECAPGYSCVLDIVNENAIGKEGSLDLIRICRQCTPMATPEQIGKPGRLENLPCL